jgi:hypothetical protein
MPAVRLLACVPVWRHLRADHGGDLKQPICPQRQERGLCLLLSLRPLLHRPLLLPVHFLLAGAHCGVGGRARILGGLFSLLHPVGPAGPRVSCSSDEFCYVSQSTCTHWVALEKWVRYVDETPTLLLALKLELVEKRRNERRRTDFQKCRGRTSLTWRSMNPPDVLLLGTIPALRPFSWSLCFCSVFYYHNLSCYNSAQSYQQIKCLFHALAPVCERSSV